MRRAPLTSLLIWTMLALVAWGGAAPRIWCSGPNGHVALESAYSSCCEDSGSPCARPAPVDTPTFSPASKLEGEGEVIRQQAGDDRCSDSLIRFLPASGAATQAVVVLIALPRALAPAQIPDPIRASAAAASSGERGGPPTPLDLRTTLLI